MDRIAAISQQLLQFSPDALIVVDAEGVILFANATSRALFGYSREQLIGQSIGILVPERFRFRHTVHMSEFLRAPTARQMGGGLIDFSARRSDGTEFPAGIRLAPVHDGEKSFIAAAIRDMTEGRLINDELILAREEADRANMAKTRFLAAASHDLRQPLQTISLLNASMMKLTAAKADLGDLLQRQEASIDSASRMLNALLDITRLESGSIEPHYETTHLASIFEDLQHEFEPAATLKGLRLTFAQTLKVLITDRILLNQLLQNLIGNSIKYTDGGFVTVYEQIEADGFILYVVDSGCGIPDAKLERIFDDYYQAHASAPERSGVGLGLAIVREVSRLLGYSLGVSSQLGSGTRVRVRIPLAQLATGVSSPSGTHRIAPIHIQCAPCRLILLEDNHAVRAATELFLNLEGYKTLSACNAAEAEALLEKWLPGDLLISDYQLDGALTGLDVLLRARMLHQRTLPAILLSGDLLSMMRMVKNSIPACRFLSKPVDTHALLAAIAELSVE